MKKVKILLMVVLSITLIFSFSGCSSKLQKPDKNSVIDTDRMELVFDENFDELNTDIWKMDQGTIRRGGYWDDEQIKVKNGNMIITTEYRDGEFGEGWYTGSAITKDNFYLDKGYAEVRCILSKGSGQWSAFWLSSDSMYEGGETGSEIDVVEGPYYNDPNSPEEYKNTAFHTIHAGGYGDNHQSKQSEYYMVDKNIFEEYNTYGVLWDENGYTFYVNGMKTWETDFCPTNVPEFLWLSVEIAGENGTGNPENPDNQFTWAGEIEKNEGGKDFKSEFIIDYVKCYTFK